MSPVLLALLAVVVLLAGETAADGAEPKEIARGRSWVSPYWGYNTPKIVGDGTAWYTTGIWGDAPSRAEGVLYKFTDGTWRAGATLAGLYQPATILLDSTGRVIVLYTRANAPVRIARATTPGDIGELTDLPHPPEMHSAYYIGAAIRDDVVYLAYLGGERQDMMTTRLSLESNTWDVPRRISEGHLESLPKTAWTYPVVLPSADGVHIIASNSPDGGVGNTYNEVWHVHVPQTGKPVREQVLAAPVGHLAFALDAAFDSDGGLHVLCNWNQRVYGDPLPEGSPEAGLYHVWRDAAADTWNRERLAAPAMAGFAASENLLDVVISTNEGIIARAWEHGQFRAERRLCTQGQYPASPSFMDIATLYSGNRGKGIAFVTEGLVADPPGDGFRILWSCISGTED